METLNIKGSKHMNKKGKIMLTKRKQFLLAAACAACVPLWMNIALGCASCASTRPPAGFYVGVQGGCQIMSYKRDSNVTGVPGPTLSTDTGRTNKSTIIGGPFFGYRWNLNHAMFVALEGNLSLSKIKHDKADSRTMPMPSGTPGCRPGCTTVYSQRKDDPSYGIGIRGGMDTGYGFGVYMKLGLDRSRFTQKARMVLENNTVTFTNIGPSTTRTGFVPGIGIEKYCGPWCARAEYTMSIYPNVSRDNERVDSSTVVNQSLKSINLHTMQVGLSYVF